MQSTPSSATGVGDSSEADGPREVSCAKVFAITELAEQILLDLPISDILCGAQQVCQQWRNVVQDSEPIQEHLFMKPISKTPLHLLHVPLLKQPNFTFRHWAEPQNPGMWTSVLENPFLILLSHVKMSDAMARPGASWRRMLITQPPIAEIELSTRSSMADLKGISLGHLEEVSQREGTLNITAWSVWKAYQGSQQLRRIKQGLRKQSIYQAPLDPGCEVYEDELWWMGDEYLSGI